MASVQRTGLLILILAIAGALIIASLTILPDLLSPEAPLQQRSATDDDDPPALDPFAPPNEELPTPHRGEAPPTDLPRKEIDETPKPTLTGTTVDDIGRRVPAVRLIVHDDQDALVADTRSDTSGEFDFVLPPGEYSITLEHDLYFAAGPFDVAVIDGERTEVELALRMGALLQGRVQDADGRAVPSAHILVLPQGGVTGDPDRLRGRTDESGAFRLTGLPADATLRVLARAPEHGDGELSSIRLSQGEESSPVEIQLTRGGTIEGRVLLPGGGPTGVAQVRFHLESDPWHLGPPDELGPPVIGVTTEGDGHFEVAHLPAGEYTIIAEWREQSAQLTGYPISDSVRTSGVQIFLSEGEQIRGQVTGGDGERVPGARVTARRGGLLRHATTDEDGLYEINGLTAGTFLVEVNAEGYAVAERSEVSAGSERIDFLLTAGDAISGTVRDEGSGSPVTRFRVLLDPVATEGERIWKEFANETGEFRFDNVAPGRWLLFTASRTHFADVREIVVRAGAGLEELDIGLRAGGTLRGVVLDATERRPVAKARVEVIAERDPNDSSTRSERIAERLSSLVGHPPGKPLITDQEGRFLVDGLPRGTYRLAVSAESFLTTTVGPFDPELAEDTLIYLQIGGSIHGTVYLPSARPAPGAVVTATNEDGAYQRVEADDRGRYEIFGLSPGPYFMTFSHPRAPVTGPPDRTRREPVRTFVQAGVPTLQDLGFQLENDVRFFGRVIDRQRTVSGAKVLFQSLNPAQKDETSFELTSGSGGAFEKEGMQAGVYQVTITLAREAGLTFLFQIDVPAVPEYQYDFDLGRGSISGRVQSSQPREPLSDVLVYASAAEGARAGAWHPTDPSARTDSEGQFQITGLAPGVYVVRARYVGGADVYVNVTIPEVRAPRDADYRLPTIIMERGEIIRVRLENQGGDRLAGGAVALYTTDGQEVITSGTALTDANGQTEIRGVLPGEYRLDVEVRELAAQRRFIEVRAGRAFEEIFVVDPGGSVILTTIDRDGNVVPGVPLDVRDGFDLPYVRVFDRHDLVREYPLSDAGGAYILNYLAPGEYTARTASTPAGPVIAFPSRNGGLTRMDIPTR